MLQLNHTLLSGTFRFGAKGAYIRITCDLSCPGRRIGHRNVLKGSSSDDPHSRSGFSTATSDVKSLSCVMRNFVHLTSLILFGKYP